MKRWGKRVLFGLIALTLIGWVAGKVLLRYWAATPPSMPADVSIMRLKPETRSEKVWLGKSWFARREGLPVVFLKGSPFEIGWAEGQLLQQQMHTLENDFIDMIHSYVPEDWKVDLLKSYVIYRNRHLTDFVPLNYRSEIHGTTLGCPDGHPELGPYYNRMLNYHAAHDISYMMIDNPLVSRAGCTSFGAWGKETDRGHLITGRNFDWEAAEVFSRDRVVLMCEPDGGIPLISLSWAGMAGVVSGMNRAGLSVTINGAPSGLPKETATPVAILARDVLQRAHNLSEALDLLRSARVFVSTIWLVGSRADGRFVVVEKTPGVMQVREPEGDSIVCANHFQSPSLRDDPRNTNYTAEATSVLRQTRLRELMDGARGAIDSMKAVEFLRDRKLPGGAFPGNHHRATLNALIATHATVMDLTDGIFWAASPPNQLGKFVAFDVQDFSHELPDRTVLADKLLTSGEFEKAKEARKCIADGQRFLQNKDPGTALKMAAKAETLNPGFYQNSALRGRALLALGQRQQAADAFETALKEQPAFLAEKRRLEQWLQQARAPK